MSTSVEKSAFGDMKYDDGKLVADIIFDDFADALEEVMKVADGGAKKYKRSSWRTIKDPSIRYQGARARHFTKSFREKVDKDSKLSHLAHEAWNCLALLQLEIENDRG